MNYEETPKRTSLLPALQKNIFDTSPQSRPTKQQLDDRLRYQMPNNNPHRNSIQFPSNHAPEQFSGPPMYPPPVHFQPPYGAHPNFYGGGYYGQPFPNPQPRSDNELKYQFERQNSLLEQLNKKFDSRSKQSHYKNHQENFSSETFNRKLQELERANEIKMKLFNQQQMINNLSLKKSIPNFMQPFFNDRNPSPLFRDQGPDHRDDIIAFQNNLINNLVMPEDFLQNLMERVAPNPYQIPPYMNQQYYHPPPPNYYKHRSSDTKKRKKKSKKDRRNTSDSSIISDTSENSQDDKRNKKSKDKDKKRNSDAKPSQRKNTHSSQRGDSVEGDEDVEDEEQKKLLEQKKKTAKRNLKIILWSSVYPIFLNLEITEKVDQRKKAQTSDLLKDDEAMEKALVTWMHTLTQKGFDQIFNEKNKNYDFIGSAEGGRPINSDIKSRATHVKDVVKTLIENLSNNTRSVPLKDENRDYLTALILGEFYAFNNKLSNYEIARINFNTYGRFIDIKREQSEMILICTLFVRILVYQLLLSAKEWHDKIELTDRLPTNLKIIGSVIYRIAMMWLDEKVKPINTETVSKAVIAMPPLKANENVEVNPDLEKTEIIFGLYTADELTPVLGDKKWFEPVQALAFNWISGLYNHLFEYRKTHPKKEYK